MWQTIHLAGERCMYAKTKQLGQSGGHVQCKAQICESKGRKQSRNAKSPENGITGNGLTPGHG